MLGITLLKPQSAKGIQLLQFLTPKEQSRETDQIMVWIFRSCMNAKKSKGQFVTVQKERRSQMTTFSNFRLMCLFRLRLRMSYMKKIWKKYRQKLSWKWQMGRPRKLRDGI